jgi:hypothetical protein
MRAEGLAPKQLRRKAENRLYAGKRKTGKARLQKNIVAAPRTQKESHKIRFWKITVERRARLISLS